MSDVRKRWKKCDATCCSYVTSDAHKQQVTVFVYICERFYMWKQCVVESTAEVFLSVCSFSHRMREPKFAAQTILADEREKSRCDRTASSEQHTSVRDARAVYGWIITQTKNTQKTDRLLLQFVHSVFRMCDEWMHSEQTFLFLVLFFFRKCFSSYIE